MGKCLELGNAERIGDHGIDINWKNAIKWQGYVVGEISYWNVGEKIDILENYVKYGKTERKGKGIMA